MKLISAHAVMDGVFKELGPCDPVHIISNLDTARFSAEGLPTDHTVKSFGELFAVVESNSLVGEPGDCKHTNNDYDSDYDFGRFFHICLSLLKKKINFINYIISQITKESINLSGFDKFLINYPPIR